MHEISKSRSGQCGYINIKIYKWPLYRRTFGFKKVSCDDDVSVFDSLMTAAVDNIERSADDWPRQA